jgi:hypothetical protein
VIGRPSTIGGQSFGYPAVSCANFYIPVVFGERYHTNAHILPASSTGLPFLLLMLAQKGMLSLKAGSFLKGSQSREFLT